jgi:hypothetical protein
MLLAENRYLYPDSILLAGLPRDSKVVYNCIDSDPSVCGTLRKNASRLNKSALFQDLLQQLWEVLP